MFAPLLISVEEANGLRIVDVAGEIDLATSPALANATRAARGDPPALVVDLTRTSFLDCTGLHILVDACLANAAAGRGFAIVHGSGDEVGRTLEVLAEAGVRLPIYRSRGAAVAAAIAAPEPVRMRSEPEVYPNAR
jgi:anti-sigma B factor antagonist